MYSISISEQLPPEKQMFMLVALLDAGNEHEDFFDINMVARILKTTPCKIEDLYDENQTGQLITHASWIHKNVDHSNYFDGYLSVECAKNMIKSVPTEAAQTVFDYYTTLCSMKAAEWQELRKGMQTYIGQNSKSI